MLAQVRRMMFEAWRLVVEARRAPAGAVTPSARIVPFMEKAIGLELRMVRHFFRRQHRRDAKARRALCAADPAKAWSALMHTGQAPAARPCESNVDKLVTLGTHRNVRGTPTVFFADGRRAQGAVPPEEFMAMLNQAP